MVSSEAGYQVLWCSILVLALGSNSASHQQSLQLQGTRQDGTMNTTAATSLDYRPRGLEQGELSQMPWPTYASGLLA